MNCREFRKSLFVHSLSETAQDIGALGFFNPIRAAMAETPDKGDSGGDSGHPLMRTLAQDFGRSFLKGLNHTETHRIQINWTGTVHASPTRTPTIQESKRISPVISVSEYRELRRTPSLTVGCSIIEKSPNRRHGKSGLATIEQGIWIVACFSLD